MTMKIIITNADATRKLKVTTQDLAADKSVVKAESQEVLPGEQLERYIYTSRNVLCEEE